MPLTTEQMLGLFLPNTYLFDAENLQGTDINTLVVRLYQNVNSMLIALNLKETGYYVEQEYINGQLFFPDPTNAESVSVPSTYRQVFRKVVNFGELPNSTAKNVAHGIDFGTLPTPFKGTRIYGCATDPATGTMIPLPFASPTSSLSISLAIDPTHVIITTGSNYSSYTQCFVIIEMIKQ